MELVIVFISCWYSDMSARSSRNRTFHVYQHASNVQSNLNEGIQVRLATYSLINRHVYFPCLAVSSQIATWLFYVVNTPLVVANYIDLLHSIQYLSLVWAIQVKCIFSMPNFGFRESRV